VQTGPNPADPAARRPDRNTIGLLTRKATLAAGTELDTYARLPSARDGQVLTADLPMAARVGGGGGQRRRALRTTPDAIVDSDGGCVLTER
jgi:hypothetical protein